MNEEKKDISKEYNSVFDQNTPTDIENTFESREYMQAIFGQEIDGATNDVLYTRTQYIKDYTEIVDAYKKERNEQIKSIAIVLAAALILQLIANLRYMMMGTSVITGLLKYLGSLISVIVIIVPPFLILGYVKRIFKSRELMKKAIQKIESTKQEHMQEGTYDAGR